MTDDGEPERLEAMLTPEPRGMLRRVVAVLLLLIGVPLLLGAGFCAIESSSVLVRPAARPEELDFTGVALKLGSLGIALGALMVWGGWRLLRRRTPGNEAGNG
jgi:hypothetical protein